MLTLLRATPRWKIDSPDPIKPDTLNESYQSFPNRSIEDWRQQ